MDNESNYEIKKIHSLVFKNDDGEILFEMEYPKFMNYEKDEESQENEQPNQK